MKLFNFDGILENVKGYVEAQVSLVKLELKEESAEVARKVIVGVILSVLALFTGFFISFALAFYLNYLLGSIYLGFVIISLVYILALGWLIWIKDRPFFKERIQRLINNK